MIITWGYFSWAINILETLFQMCQYILVHWTDVEVAVYSNVILQCLDQNSSNREMNRMLSIPWNQIDGIFMAVCCISTIHPCQIFELGVLTVSFQSMVKKMGQLRHQACTSHKVKSLGSNHRGLWMFCWYYNLCAKLRCYVYWINCTLLALSIYCRDKMMLKFYYADD